MPPGNQIEWSIAVHTLRVAVRTGPQARCVVQVIRENGWSRRLEIKSCDPEHEDLKQIIAVAPEVDTVLHEAKNETERFDAILTSSAHQGIEVNVNINLADNDRLHRLTGVMYNIDLARAKERARQYRNKHARKKE